MKYIPIISEIYGLTPKGRVANRKKRNAYNINKAHQYRKKFNGFLRVLGPGITTGAADDDPSGIATYSQTGAAHGYSLLWLFPVMFPLLLAVQETCARVGAVTGDGLAAILKKHYSKKLLYSSVFLVVIANVINIGSDLAAMAAATELLLPIPFTVLAIGFALLSVVLQVFVPYRTYSQILKWLAIVLFAYPVTTFLVGADWGQVLTSTFTPHMKWDADTIYLVVGIIGTTISPYLFFWNTSEVVEDEIKEKRIRSSSTNAHPRISKRFMRHLKIDNFVGMSLATVTAWFIVIACAAVLNTHGITEINSASDAAKALEPLVKGFPNAGLFAKLLFSVGIIGIGLLAVPVLAGSSAYAASEALGMKEGLYRKFSKAHGFYGVIIAATLAGLAINFMGIDPIQALLFTAVFNAVASIPLLWMILRVANNPDVMGDYRNGPITNLGILAAFGLTSVATIALLVISFWPK